MTLIIGKAHWIDSVKRAKLMIGSFTWLASEISLALEAPSTRASNKLLSSFIWVELIEPCPFYCPPHYSSDKVSQEMIQVLWMYPPHHLPFQLTFTPYVWWPTPANCIKLKYILSIRVIVRNMPKRFSLSIGPKLGKKI